MVVGGYTGSRSKVVELFSLDKENHPVPDCMRFPAKYPQIIKAGAGSGGKDGEFYNWKLNSRTINRQDNYASNLN